MIVAPGVLVAVGSGVGVVVTVGSGVALGKTGAGSVGVKPSWAGPTVVQAESNRIKRESKRFNME